MEQHIFKQITIDPAARFRKPVIAGTRVPVDLIVGKIAGGMTTEAVIDEDLPRSFGTTFGALGFANTETVRGMIRRLCSS